MTSKQAMLFLSRSPRSSRYPFSDIERPSENSFYLLQWDAYILGEAAPDFLSGTEED